MYVIVILDPESFMTHLTDVGAHSVRFAVFVQVVFPTEVFAAYFALVELLARVAHGMAEEVFFPAVRFVAAVTLERPLSWKITSY